jgi:predicted alpha/beta-fold hydrolase
MSNTCAPELPFRPLPCLANAHLQTIVASQLYLPLEPPSVTRLVPLPDGDHIALEVATPAAWQPEQPTVVMIHGLCGCHRSPYMMRLAYKFWRHGMRAVRLNLRGCGSGFGLARQPYHSGRSADVLCVLQALQQETPQSPTTLLGFSLGGNIALKLAGELQGTAATYLKQVIAVCPPADLAACSRLLGQPANRLYEQRFMRLLRAAVDARQRRFPEVPRVALPARLSLYTFDNIFTAPLCGPRACGWLSLDGYRVAHVDRRRGLTALVGHSPCLQVWALTQERRAPYNTALAFRSFSSRCSRRMFYERLASSVD